VELFFATTLTSRSSASPVCASVTTYTLYVESLVCTRAEEGTVSASGTLWSLMDTLAVMPGLSAAAGWE